MHRDLIDNTLIADEATAYSLAVLSYPENHNYLFQVLDFLPSRDLLTIQSTAPQFNTVVSHLLLWQKFNGNPARHYSGHYLGKYLLLIDWKTETQTINTIIAKHFLKKRGEAINLTTAFTLYPKFFRGLAISNANLLMGLANKARAQATELQQNKVYYHPTTHTFTYPSETNAQEILHYLHTAKQLESLLLKLMIYSETYPLAVNPLDYNPIPYCLNFYQSKSGLSFKEVVEMDIFFGHRPQRSLKILLAKWTKINAKLEAIRSTKEKHKITIIEEIFQTATRKDILDAQSLGLFSEGNNDASYFNSPLLRLIDHLREEEILALVKTIPIYRIPSRNILGIDDLFIENSYFNQKASLSLKLQTMLSHPNPSRQLFEQLLLKLKQLKHTEREKLLHNILDEVIDRGIFFPQTYLNVAQLFKHLSNKQRLASTLQKFLAADMSNKRVIIAIESLAEENKTFKTLLSNSHALLTKLCDYYKKPAQNITLSKWVLEGLTANIASRMTGALAGALFASLFWLISYPILVLGIVLLPPAAVGVCLYRQLWSYSDKTSLALNLLAFPLSLLVALSAPILALIYLPCLLTASAKLGYQTGLLNLLKNNFKLPWLISQGKFGYMHTIFEPNDTSFSINNILHGLEIYLLYPLNLLFDTPTKAEEINNILAYYHQLKTKLETASLLKQPKLKAITLNKDSTFAKPKMRESVNQQPTISQTVNQFGIFAIENSREITRDNSEVSNNSYRISL